MAPTPPLLTDEHKITVSPKAMLFVHGQRYGKKSPGQTFRGPGVEQTSPLPVPDAGPISPAYTDNRLRPLRRRAFSTLRPPRVDIRARNPCRRWRRLVLGCQVRFGIQSHLHQDRNDKLLYLVSHRLANLGSHLVWPTDRSRVAKRARRRTGALRPACAYRRLVVQFNGI